MLQEPLLHVEETVTDAQVDGEVTEPEVYEVQVPPLLVTPQAPDAEHEPETWEHEPYDPGVVLHEPLLHVEETETEEHTAGDVTVLAVYDVQVPPLLVAPQPPDAAQLEQEAEHVLYGVAFHEPFVQVNMVFFAGQELPQETEPVE